MVYYARVIVMHSVDVGPYLYFLSVYSGTYERCCVVAAAPLQIVYLAVGVAADEALSDVNLLSFVLPEYVVELLFDVLRRAHHFYRCA